MEYATGVGWTVGEGGKSQGICCGTYTPCLEYHKMPMTKAKPYLQVGFRGSVKG